MNHNPRYLLRHLSCRVPWHDNGWNGTVCKNPAANGACLILKNCALERDDQKEQKLAGHSLEGLEEEDFPVCVGERATFMTCFPFYRTLRHPYAAISKATHGRLKDTRVRYPAYAVAAVPYYWMLKENAKEKVSLYDLDYDPDREPELAWKDSWVQEIHNQRALLDCFFEHFEEKTSLVFFYAKQVPFIEDSSRVLIGVGRINKIIPSEAYEGSDNRFGAAYWEHMILHSIRPDGKDGFLLPYHEGLEYQKEHPGFDMSELAVCIPNDKRFEFSYGGEHVSNDSAIRVLLACMQSLEKAQALGIGTGHAKMIGWIHDEIASLEKLRGNYPGMGSALCALGIEKGHFVAAEIINSLKDEKGNPWLLFEQELKQPASILSSEISRLLPESSKQVYLRLKKENGPRIHFLYLLSRFDLTAEQAKVLFVKEEGSVVADDSEILKNPYRIYEILRHTTCPVDLSTIDLGLYLKGETEQVLPAGSVYTDPYQVWRLRALTVQQLERAAFAGHTLLPRGEIVRQIRLLPVTPSCQVTGDYFTMAEPEFLPEVHVVSMKSGEEVYQLQRYVRTKAIISDKVRKRIQASQLSVEADWEALLDAALKDFTPDHPDEQELRARQEKVEALRMLAGSRFSVLIGPAGTGKTTLLSVLAGQESIAAKGVLLLAPTGKARVRMEELAKHVKLTARTLAQFLSGYNRYRGDIQQYVFSDQYWEEGFETVILDEASMLTEEMLATTLDCLRGVKRFILAGDHRQLPPIGAGRPFVDIVQFLKPEEIAETFPRIGKGYTELTVKRRQGGNSREDIQLAEWFGGEALEPGADAVLNRIIHQPESPYLRVEYWQNESDFEQIFEKVLVEELGLKEDTEVSDFNKTLGSTDGKYFNFREAVKQAEAWQILSPVREKVFGVKAINRFIHQWFRKDKIEYARKGSSRLPAPVGLEEIVYGDKVINLYNQKRDKVYPADRCLCYIANGEIGMVVGQLKRKADDAKFKGKPKNTEIEFTSQPGYKYTFRASEFREEGENPLELAYALTVHKAQGSEFGKVFLIVPNPCLLLTREMLCTSLTRQRDKVIILYQGESLDIASLASPLRSDTLRRITNLFENPEPVKIEEVLLEKNLIQCASDGRLLRSKSELAIYQHLIDRHFNPVYEKKLVIDGVMKLPDFTIEDEDSGEIFYWEHCGMLYDEDYRRRWEEKLQWYRKNGILPWQEGGGERGTLIVTGEKMEVLEDHRVRGAISMQEIDGIIEKVLMHRN